MRALIDHVRRGIAEGAGLVALVITIILPLVAAVCFRVIGASHTRVSSFQLALVEQGGKSHDGFVISMLLSALPIYVGILSAWVSVRVVARDRDIGALNYLNVYSARPWTLLVTKWAAAMIASCLLVAAFACSAFISGELIIKSGVVTTIIGATVSGPTASSVEVHGLATIVVLAIVTASTTACFGLRFGTASAFVLGCCLYFSAVVAANIPGLSEILIVSPFRLADDWLAPLSNGLISENFVQCVGLSLLWVIGGAALCVGGWIFRSPRVGDV